MSFTYVIVSMLQSCKLIFGSYIIISSWNIIVEVILIDHINSYLANTGFPDSVFLKQQSLQFFLWSSVLCES